MNDITSLIDSLIQGGSAFDALLVFLLIFTRWLVMTLMMPFLGAELLPSPVRLTLAVILTIVSFSFLNNGIGFSEELNIFLIGVLFLKEALLGFILGFFSSLIFYAYELFGELVDFSRAASMSKLLVPELKHQSSAAGVLLFQLSLVIFLKLGLHREIISAAYKSFQIFPPLSLNAKILSDDVFSLSIGILGTLLETALMFASPVVLVCFLLDVAFGLLNRIAPQINAYFLSLPAKMIGGIAMLFFLLPFLLDGHYQHFNSAKRFFYMFLKPEDFAGSP